MRAKPRKRMRSGSMSSLKAALWSAINYNLDVIEDATQAHELRQKACNCLVQGALAYARVCELADVEADMRRYEHLLKGYVRDTCKNRSQEHC